MPMLFRMISLLSLTKAAQLLHTTAAGESNPPASHARASLLRLCRWCAMAAAAAAAPSDHVHEAVEACTYPTAAPYAERFKPSRAKAIIGAVLRAKLASAQYNPDACAAWAREAADEIKQWLKAEGWVRYKFCVQVVIGEQRGAGCRTGCRCFWDEERDSCAHDTFSNETILCTAAVFATYVY